MDICTAAFTTFLNSSIIPLAAMASGLTAVFIAAGYMIGQVFGNVKASTWAKTEAVQIIVSIASLAFIILLLNSFCAINPEEIKTLFGQSTTSPPCATTPPTSPNIYYAAHAYLKSAACHAHNAMIAVRYHLEAYTVLSNLNLFECSLSTGPIGWGCWYGYSGETYQPLGGYSAIMSAMNVFFNSTIVSYISAMNFLFILLFVYKGFVLFFLPLGIFLRSMPYLRTFGSLLISVALSFLVIYPLLLSIFWIMGDGIFYAPPDIPQPYSEDVFGDTSGFAGTLTSYYVKHIYFGDGEKPVQAIEYASSALIAGVFLPTLALLGTLASIRYTSKILGEEIDLSRIVQMV